MSEMAPEKPTSTPDKVATDLTEIESLYAQLPDQAINDADNPDIPGGRAMYALAPVANIEAWEHMNQATERLGRAYTFEDLEDPESSWPAFQLVAFWASEWRRERSWETEKRPTMSSEIAFIRYSLEWAWDNEPRWPAAATDIHTARMMLEDILTAGKRTTRGVQCLGCSVDLIRIEHDRKRCYDVDADKCATDCTHDRGGLTDQWKCPKCDRRYDHEDYKLAVHHAHFVHADYLTIDDAATRTKQKTGSIKGWASLGYVKKHRDVNSGRMTYCVADIERQGARIMRDEAG